MTNFLNPNKILDGLDIRIDMTAADFGCGAGAWTVPLARRLKKGKIYGLVYGLDILDEPLSVLQNKVRLENICNVRTIRADLEKDRGSTLPDNSLDLVLATNLFFQAEDKSAVLREIKRTLKKDGQALIIDWLMHAPLGPNQGRIASEEMQKLAREFGFAVKKQFKAGVYHWGMVLVKG